MQTAKDRFAMKANCSQPLVSVVVPTYNRAETLRECLAALAAQDFPYGGFETVVVDDGSSDNTAEVVRQARSPYPVHYLRQENSGPAAARNRGVERAAGDLILIVNDDAIVSANLVAGHYYMHRKMECGGRLAVLGTREYRNADKLRPLNFLYDQVPFSMRVYGMRAGFYPAAYFVTFNISLRKSDFETLGGFDEDFTSAIGEDTEFGVRWQTGGGKIFFLPQLRAHHVHDVTLEGLKSMIVRETFNRLILIHKQRAFCRPLDLFRRPEPEMRRELDRAAPAVRQFESALRECENLSLWDMEGKEFLGKTTGSVTDFVIAVRRIYPRYHAYVALERYLSDPTAKEMVKKWDAPSEYSDTSQNAWRASPHHRLADHRGDAGESFPRSFGNFWNAKKTKNEENDRGSQTERHPSRHPDAHRGQHLSPERDLLPKPACRPAEGPAPGKPFFLA